MLTTHPSHLNFLALLLLLLGSSTSPTSAGPACARRSQGLDACLDDCASNWGWPGHLMGSDPWGNVLNPASATDALAAAVTKACRVRPR